MRLNLTRLCVLASAIAFLAGSLAAQTPSLIQGQAPVINAASGADTASRGSIVSIFGRDFAIGLPNAMTTSLSVPLSTSLGGFSVEFNGTAAPLFGVFESVFGDIDQANAQIPWEVDASSGMVTVVVKQGAMQSAPQQIPVAAASPGIFTFAGNGTGPAIVQNFKLSAQDDVIAGSFAQPAGFNPALTSQPAAVGGVIIVYANGFGALANPSQGVSGGVPGTAAPVANQVRVFIGGVEAQVITLNGASGFLHADLVGLNQVNAIIPNVPPGDALAIQLEINGVRSTEAATIAVRAAPAAAALLP